MPSCIIVFVMNFKNLPKQKLIRIIAILGSCLLLALLYLGGFLYYSSHFLPGTYINDVDVSKKTLSEANTLLKDLSPYIDVIELDKNEEPVTDRVDLRKVSDSISYDASKILSDQDKISWFIPSDKHLICNKISGSYTKAKIKSVIQGFYFLNKENIVMPQDATLVIENNKVVLKSEINGNCIEEKAVINRIDEAIKDYFSGNGTGKLDLSDSYAKPLIKADDPSFEGKPEIYQKALDKTVNIKITDDRTIALNKDKLCGLLKFESSELTVDQDNLTQFIHDFYEEYKNEESNYIDRSALQNDLSKSLLSDSDQNVSVSWTDKANSGRIEVEILKQSLYYYENDTLILSSPIVSGNPEITDETPHGNFEIRRMSEDSYLMGRDYLEHVDFWIGFDPSGRVYGLHDASWRNEFGGDIYLYDPSRGCVNMPTDKITILFDYVDIGTPVYIHD